MKKVLLLAVAATLVTPSLLGCGQKQSSKSAHVQNQTKSSASSVAEKPAETSDNSTDPNAITSVFATPENPAAGSNTTLLAAKPLPKEATAKDVMEQMAAQYKSIKTLALSGTISVNMSDGKRNEKSDGAIGMEFSRPNKMRVTTGNGKTSNFILSDGKNIYVYASASKVYQKGPAPKKLGESGMKGGDRISSLMLLDGMNIDALAKKSKLLPSEKVNGVDTYVIELPVDREPRSGVTSADKIWIGKSDLLIRKIQSTKTIPVATLAKMMQPGQKPPKSDAVMVQTTLIKKVVANQPLPAGEFKFVAPKGAKEFKQPKMQAPPNVTGKKAPDYSGSTIDGGRISPADYKGKPVLIVFWASASPQAKKDMSKYETVSNQMKNAKMIGVSLDADKAVASKIMAENGVKFPVIFGQSDAIRMANDFGLRGLPTMFAIGADGTVKTRIEGVKSIDSMKSELAKLGIR